MASYHDYTTVSGDMWDKIAFEQMGSENYMGILIEENRHLIDYVVFPSGIQIAIPDIVTNQIELPSWRKGLDEEEDDLTEFEEEEEL